MTVDARPSPAALALVDGTRRGARDMDMKLEVVVVPVSGDREELTRCGR
jgi:hypothetical protein